jgi:hypothetical protein
VSSCLCHLVQRTSRTYMDALLGPEVKSTRGESGRYWETIDVLARGYGIPKPQSSKRASHRAQGTWWLVWPRAKGSYFLLPSAGCQKIQPFVG